MALTKYNAKRNFGNTPEPAGAVDAARKFRFVVQRHDASRLHYDFRLELDGVLKSWAVPRGPSLNPTDKRLAVMVEDHPVSYIGFEGRIPEGNYGAGTVLVWDKGSYTPVNEKHEIISEKQAITNLKKGELKFSIKGRKLKGEFVLVKFRSSDSENNWLLIKHRDEYAVEDEYNSEDFLPKKAVKKKSSSTSKKSAQTKKKK